MQKQQLNNFISVSDQLVLEDIKVLADEGVDLIICNRQDDEAADQIPFHRIAEAAHASGIKTVHIPFVGGQMTASHVAAFKSEIAQAKKVHAYCRTGNRSTQLWKAAQEKKDLAPEGASDSAQAKKTKAKPLYDVVIVGAGSGGVATAASLLKRNSSLRICLVDPAKHHYYQPGWTLVGGGVFDAKSTCKNMMDVIPKGTSWVNEAVKSFEPEDNKLSLENGDEIHYRYLVVAAGIKLHWDAIQGLKETLGKNGVTSNYHYDLAPYTWELVRQFSAGKAIFTQPPMPIKCAGAPQKAMYLSCDHWLRNKVLSNVDVQFYNAGAVLFGVKDYVPALEAYIAKYNVNLNFSHNLVKVDGTNKRAYFAAKNEQGEDCIHETDFDMLHVCPPQTAPDFVRSSVLADAAGWVDVDQTSLRHKRFSNVWGLGDCTNSPNAKTMAAARKQAPVVAHNICDALDGVTPRAEYDGYGSCPLTVERGKIVLAEFGYGGKLLPTFPNFINDGTKPTRLAWILKEDLLPPFYWQGMLKGREWFVKPHLTEK